MYIITLLYYKNAETGNIVDKVKRKLFCFVLRHARYLLNRRRKLTANINFSGCYFLRYCYKYVRRNYSISFVSHPLLRTLRKTCFTKTKDLRFCPDLTLSFTCSTYFVDGHSLQILTIHTA